ncbi:MAG: tRNA-binding protein [Patescibacteria group bacterium]
MATFDDFQKLDIRVGKIIEVADFPEARKPMYKLKIDFGKEIGIKQSCGQVTHYGKDELKDKLIVGVLNFPPKHIGPEISEVLCLGVPDEEDRAILLSPDKDVPLGGKVF